MIHKTAFFISSFLLKTSFLIAFLWISADLTSIAQDSWKWVEKEDNINIYTRPASPFDEIKMTCNINASPNQLLAIIRDVENYTNWVYKCTEAKRLKTNSDSDYYYYSKSDFPFPFSDRDIVVHCVQQVDPVNNSIYSRSVIGNYPHPKEKSTVRINELEAQWAFTQRKDGTVDLEYTVKTNPGGNIPAWLVDLGIKEGPIQTMKAFIQKATSNNPVLKSQIKF